MGENLNDPEKAKVIGFEVTSYFPESKAGLVNYVIKNEEYKKGNANGNPNYQALPMMEHAVAYLEEITKQQFGSDIKVILWESNDPAKIQWNPQSPDLTVDVMAPARRIQLVEEKFGFVRVNMDYVQGDISGPDNYAKAECSDLILYICKNSDGKIPTDDLAQTLKAYLIEFNRHFNDGKSLKTSEGKQMMTQVEEMIHGERPVLVEKPAPARIIPSNTDICLSEQSAKRASVGR
ncbi:MAG: hypothetical protein H6908_03915 [Hyphomicrobiales bacterium]|nr:hypothetical protein [Rickettsiales bacterium]MCP5361770.1 hypothetical protein [Hyphomicrobiales bacterium]